jgi:hypothetical protein
MSSCREREGERDRCEEQFVKRRVKGNIGRHGGTWGIEANYNRGVRRGGETARLAANEINSFLGHLETREVS